MTRTIEATIDDNGEVRLDHPLKLKSGLRVLITILDEQYAGPLVIASEQSLSEWNLPEEDAAWQHLQEI